MLRNRLALAAGLLAGASLGTSLLTISSQAEAPATGCAGDPSTNDVATGEGTIAISNREIIVVGRRKSGCMYMRPALESGLLRHLAVREGTGTAYVDDHAGGDRLVVVTPRGTTELSSEDEITHPSWSSEGDLAWSADLGSLRVLSGGEVSTIKRPMATRAVFSPTFTAPDELVVVGQETVPGAPGYEDDQLNNLWSFDRATGDWTKTTHFEADSDRWSIIRTPVVADDGSLMFVRVTGRASATRAPHFQLWRSVEGRASKVRDLPDAMFLAGTRGGRLMWNVFSDRCGDWELLVESDSGMTSIGCGAVLVDPVNIKDPDLMVDDEEAPEAKPDGEALDMGVVVGDFSTKSEAMEVAEKLGPGAKVITNEDAPLAVKPDAFAVATPIASGAPTDEALDAVRSKVPALRQRVFIAPLEKLEVPSR